MLVSTVCLPACAVVLYSVIRKHTFGAKPYIASWEYRTVAADFTTPAQPARGVRLHQFHEVFTRRISSLLACLSFFVIASFDIARQSCLMKPLIGVNVGAVIITAVIYNVQQ